MDVAEALRLLAAQDVAPRVTNSPFYTAAQREVASREAKWERRRRVAKFAAGVVAALVVIHLVATQLIFDLPTETALAAQVQTIAETALSLHSSKDQPLQIDTAEAIYRDRAGIGEHRYFARVILRLRQPLYAPASTNGTAAYRQLRESLDVARSQGTKLGFLGSTQLPEPPELPLLLQVVHKIGEPMVVLVPFEAKRYGWSWRFPNVRYDRRTATPVFNGLSRSRYAQAPHLIFGGPETFGEIRERMKRAKAYILAVAKEVQRFTLAEAVSDPATAPPPAATEPVADRPAAGEIDPNATAVPAGPGIDPNATAVPATSVPAQPEADSDAAVKLPGGTPRKESGPPAR